MTPHFDRLVSIEAAGDVFRIKALTPDNGVFEFTMARDLVGMLVATLLGAAKDLTPTDRHRAITNVEVEIVTGADGAPALRVMLAPNLAMVLQLRAEQWSYLYEYLDRIARPT